MEPPFDGLLFLIKFPRWKTYQPDRGGEGGGGAKKSLIFWNTCCTFRKRRLIRLGKSEGRVGVGIIVKQKNRMQRAPCTLSDFTQQWNLRFQNLFLLEIELQHEYSVSWVVISKASRIEEDKIKHNASLLFLYTRSVISTVISICSPLTPFAFLTRR